MRKIIYSVFLYNFPRMKKIYISSEKFTWLSVFVNLLTKARREKGDDNYWEFWVLFKIKNLSHQ